MTAYNPIKIYLDDCVINESKIQVTVPQIPPNMKFGITMSNFGMILDRLSKKPIPTSELIHGRYLFEYSLTGSINQF
jgi:hypothetical protein